jgi:hypothetical protein
MKSIKLILASLAILVSGAFSTTQAQCVATYSDTAWSANQVFFESTYNAVGSTWYDWYFQGGTPSSLTGFGQDSVTVTYPSVGWYEVCFTVYDSVANCGDSICDSIYVGWANSPVTGTISSMPTSCGACTGTATVTGTG